MKRLFLFITFCGFLLSGGWLSLLGPQGLLTPPQRQEALTVVFPRHTGLLEIAQKLEEAGAIRSVYPFLFLAFVKGKQQALKAGEYEIPPQASLQDILELIVEGRVVKHLLTIPEGFTVVQVTNLLNEIPILEGEIREIPSEGHLLPATYEYVHGDDRQSLLTKMHKKMERLLQKLWEKRLPDSPLQTLEDVLILASIVEKETALSDERAHIAGVFLNRLRQKIPLQADPTVIYGITQGKIPFERSLTYKDLQTPTPYNTYTRLGLPPTAIACPGKASLKAVLNPHKTADLYFVADGRGGHAFSSHFADHRQKVKQWRQEQAKEIKE